MSCTNCFSGCVETTSDKCVKYTGNDIAFLNITKGDSLESVEEAITTYLATVYSGEGVFPVIAPAYICTIVDAYLPENPTLIDVLTAVFRAICEIEAEVVVERARIGVIEADYTMGCLTSDPDVGTHPILQEVITTLCIAIGDITTLEGLFATCVTTGTQNNISTLIQNYLNTQTTSNYWYTKMVPYVIYPFYPSTAVMQGAFDITGAGLGLWDKIYLCNGYGGLTPDLRGRSLIGTTDMGGGAFGSVVDPDLGNPAYTLGTTGGQNSVILAPSQVAAHTHIATAAVDENGGHATRIEVYTSATDVNHSPTSGCASCNGSGPYYPIIKIEDAVSSESQGSLSGSQIATTTTLDETGISVEVTNAANVGGDAHDNIHPVHACHFMMYLP